MSRTWQVGDRARLSAFASPAFRAMYGAEVGIVRGKGTGTLHVDFNGQLVFGLRREFVRPKGGAR